MSKLENKGSVIYITWCGPYFEPPVDKKLAQYLILTLQMNIQKCFVQKEKQNTYSNHSLQCFEAVSQKELKKDNKVTFETCTVEVISRNDQP